METLIETEPTEKLLIHTFTQEVERVSSEAQERMGLINSIALPKDELLLVAASLAGIESYIEARVIAENKELERLVAAGIKLSSLKYTTPPRLAELKNLLTRFQAIKAGHFEHLRFNTDSDKWEVDTEAMELYFELRKLKVWVEGVELDRYRKIERLCELFKFFNVPWTHLRESSVLAKIINATGQGITPKWQYFLRE